MTGKEIIKYILDNDSLDKEFFVNGNIPGYITLLEASVKYKVGPSTISIWCRQGLLEHIRFPGDLFYVKNDAPDPRKRGKDEVKKADSVNHHNGDSHDNTIICIPGGIFWREFESIFGGGVSSHKTDNKNGDT